MERKVTPEYFCQEDGRKQATSTYLVDQKDYPRPQPICLSDELQMQINMVHNTHTLSHPHHHHQHFMHDRTRARDDQNLGYQGTMSGN